MARTIQADGRTIQVPDDATDDEINQLVGPAPANTAPVKEGLFKSLGDQVGIDSMPTAKGVLRGLFDPREGPGANAVRGIADYGKRVLGDAKDIRAMADSPDQADRPGATAAKLLDMVPFIGPAELKAADQSSSGDKLGALGTTIGASFPVAATALGGLDDMAPGRARLGEIPSTTRAGMKFDQLKGRLSNQPVPLNASLQPLQSMAEYGEAGAQLPGPANKLLVRSQSPFPLDYPEARRFQETLGQLSRADRDALNGSQGGNLKQLNKGLFSDIRDAADTQGLGSNYEDAMTEYRRGAQLKSFGKKAVVGSLGAIGAGEAYRKVNSLMK